MTTPSYALPRYPKPDERAFADHHGQRWLVYESTVELRDESRRPCLIFESTYVARRLFVFPPNWRELEPWALEKLSWGR
jgi:hypothetical protein